MLNGWAAGANACRGRLLKHSSLLNSFVRMGLYAAPAFQLRPCEYVSLRRRAAVHGIVNIRPAGTEQRQLDIFVI